MSYMSTSTISLTGNKSTFFVSSILILFQLFTKFEKAVLSVFFLFVNIFFCFFIPDCDRGDEPAGHDRGPVPQLNADRARCPGRQ